MRRAAIDIGSEKIKLQIADINRQTGTIEKTIYTERIFNPLRLDLLQSPNETFSLSIQDQTINILQHFLQKAIDLKALECVAIATESFRIAHNGRAFAKSIQERLNLPIHVIAQEEEGILGFMSICTSLPKPYANIAVWDIGSGSMQVTIKDSTSYCVFQGRLGKTTMKKLILQTQQKNLTDTPNPILQSEVHTILKEFKKHIGIPDPHLLTTLQHPAIKIIGIGAHPQLLLKNQLYHKSELKQLLFSHLDQTDQQIIAQHDHSHSLKAFDAPSSVSDLLLTYGLMDVCGLKQLQYLGTASGISTGVLISPKYWQSTTITNSSQIF